MSSTSDVVGPLREVGAFQRRRVRLTALVIAAMALVSLALVLWSAATVGISTTFGAATPVRLPIVAFIAAIVLSPVLWSAVFRSHRYGMKITEDELVIESWWRKRTFRRPELSAAEPLPAVMRMRDGYFSARGSNSALFAVWLWPSSPEEDEIQLGVTTGSWEATSNAARRINAWLGAEVDFDEDRAYRLLEED